MLGSVFTGWTGCDEVNAEDECEVTMSSAKSVEAEFTPVPKLPPHAHQGRKHRRRHGGGRETHQAEVRQDLRLGRSGLQRRHRSHPRSRSGGRLRLRRLGKRQRLLGHRHLRGDDERSPIGHGGIHRRQANPTIPLTVTKAPGTGSGTVKGGGISCGANCISATVGITEGREITFTAKPAKGGSTFADWTGCDEVNRRQVPGDDERPPSRSRRSSYSRRSASRSPRAQAPVKAR